MLSDEGREWCTRAYAPRVPVSNVEERLGRVLSKAYAWPHEAQNGIFEHGLPHARARGGRCCVETWMMDDFVARTCSGLDVGRVGVAHAQARQRVAGWPSLLAVLLAAVLRDVVGFADHGGRRAAAGEVAALDKGDRRLLQRLK